MPCLVCLEPASPLCLVWHQCAKAYTIRTNSWSFLSLVSSRPKACQVQKNASGHFALSDAGPYSAPLHGPLTPIRNLVIGWAVNGQGCWFPVQRLQGNDSITRWASDYHRGQILFRETSEIFRGSCRWLWHAVTSYCFWAGGTGSKRCRTRRKQVKMAKFFRRFSLEGQVQVASTSLPRYAMRLPGFMPLRKVSTVTRCYTIYKSKSCFGQGFLRDQRRHLCYSGSSFPRTILSRPIASRL